MRGQIRPCAVSLLLALLRQGFPLSPMISQSLYPAALDIKAVKKAVGEYEQIAGAKVNFDKSKGLRHGAWRGGVTDPSASSGCGSGPTSNWSEIGRKYKLR